MEHLNRALSGPGLQNIKVGTKDRKSMLFNNNSGHKVKQKNSIKKT